VRDDPVPMAEVFKVPTTFQVDEYTEYKRLRKTYRDMQRKGEVGKPEVQPVPAKVAPPIPPLAIAVPLPKPLSKISPSASRTATMKRLLSTAVEPLSLSSRPTSRQGVLEEEELIRSPPTSLLRVPTQTTSRSLILGSNSESPVSDTRSNLSQPAIMPALRSSASSTQSHASEIREVAPWIDYELGLLERLVAPNEREEVPRVLRNSTRSPDTTNTSSGHSSSPMPSKGGEDKKRIFPVSSLFLGQEMKSKESRKSVIVRSRNPMAKLFDGAEDGAEDGAAVWEDFFNHKRRASSVTAKRTFTDVRQHERAISSHEAPLSPTSMRPMSPNSPLLFKRRDAICLPYDYVLSPSTPTVDFRKYAAPSAGSTDRASKDVLSTHSIPSIPLSLTVSLQDLISKPKPMSALTTPTLLPHLGQKGGEPRKELEKVDIGVPEDSSMAVDRLREFIDSVSEVKVAFRNPFQKRDEEEVTKKESSVDVAPDVIV
jgi:hypothetical protein